MVRSLAVGMAGMWMPAVFGIVTVGLLGAIGMLRGHLAAERRSFRRERRYREEMEAYVRLDPRIGATGERAEMAARVCVAISGKSQFRRVAMLLRDTEARLYVAAHAEMEPDVLEAVRQWAEVAQQRELSGGLSAGIRLGVRSLVVCFGEPAGRGVVVPVWMEGSRVAGALVVMASSVLEVRRRDAHEAVVALEALAMKLGRSMERSEMLMRAVELPVAEVVRSQSAVIGEVA